MKTLLLSAFEGPGALRLADRECPEPQSGHVVLRVEAIGINYPDLLATRGQYQHRPDLPYVPGCEVSGTITAVGADSRWSTGQQVAAFAWHGGYAEYAMVPDSAVMPLPAGATHAEGAAMVVNYQTVHFALARRGRLESGETVLVLGAGGGIGSAAVQVARGLGARVIAGCSGDAQCATAAAAGAEEVIELDESFAQTVRQLTNGRGVDVVLDPLGDRYFDEAIRTLAPEGRLLVLGFAAGAIPKVAVNRLLLRNIEVVGVAWGAFLEVDADLAGRAGAELAQMYQQGIVRPMVGRTVAFAEIPDALDLLAQGRINGKAVALLRASSPQQAENTEESAVTR